MTSPLRLSTEEVGVELRQLSTEADDRAYFAAVDASREHLSQFGDETATRYPDLESVTEARLNPADAEKLRLGIWNSEVLVGGINLAPDRYGSAEIDYWLDARHTGQGYATIAAKALVRYGARKYSSIYANVADGNEAGAAVLERAGLQMLARGVGCIAFGLSGISTPAKKKTVPQYTEIAGAQDLEKFAELPNRRDALRAKDKNNLTVFLLHGIARKLYRCPCCSSAIELGSEHVILDRVQMSKRHTHHHLDFDCVQRVILPTLRNIQVIKPEEASASAVNARKRNYRNKKRRR